MSVHIDFGTPEALAYVVEHLREQDRIEMAAMSSFSDPRTFLPSRVLMHSREYYVATREHPAAVWGYTELWPHVGGCFAFGTDEWGLVMRAVTNHVRRYMLPRIIAAGYHRMECRALADREDVRRWVTLLGGEPEALLRKAGKGGEDFMLYRWINERCPQN